MKKIIPLFTILFATLMLSGCVIFWPDDYNSTRRYSITCRNTSYTQTIYDWCVVRNGQVTYAISQSENCQILPQRYATLNNLPYGDYVLYVCTDSNPYYYNSNNTNYRRTTSFTLNENKTFSIGDSLY